MNMKRKQFDRQILSVRLRETRLEYHCSQKQLAELIGVSQDTVSLWERAKSAPNAEQLFAICRALEISSEYLLGLTDY